MSEVETKLAAARTRLILDKPFLGTLVLRLPMMQADASWCKSTATDAKTFYYNHDYIDSMSVEQAQFVLAHEALHCALSHFSRRQHRVKHRWDLACDLAINPILINEGMQPIADTLYDKQYDGMTAEEIYPTIEDLDDRETQDQHVYDEDDREQNENDDPSDDDKNDDGEKGDKPKDDKGTGGDKPQTDNDNQSNGNEAELDETQGGAGQPPPLTESEKESLSVQWQQRLAGAAQTAMQSGKMGDALARLVDHFLQPQLPWRMLLARYMTGVARDDYSFQRPSRREGEAILPSLRSSQVDLTVVIDTSGSISDDEVAEFISEVDAIKGQMRARITLLACDDHVSENAPWLFEPWDTFDVPDDMMGGGATDFRPAFTFAEQLGKQPDLLIYFTDAEGEFPTYEPAFPVIWLVKGKQKTPWGQRVQLN